MVQQSPGGRRLPGARFANKEPGGAITAQRGGVEEEEVRPAFLDVDDDRLFHLEYKFAEVGGGQWAAVVPAQDEA